MNRWIWPAVGLIVAGLGLATLMFGLDRADNIASVVGGAAAVIGLALSAGSSYKLAKVVVRQSGLIQNSGTGAANTGIDLESSAQVQGKVEVKRSGDIEGSGEGETNTGIRIR